MADSRRGRIASERVLGDELAKALRIFDEGQSVDGGRLGSMHALRAVIEWLMDRPWHQREKLPLSALWSALADVHEGVTPPEMLQPAPGRSKPRVRSQILEQRAYAAGALELLMAAGMERQKAAREIARRTNDWVCMTDVKGERWRAIARWRDDLKVHEPTWRCVHTDSNPRPPKRAGLISVFGIVLSTIREQLANGIDARSAAMALIERGARFGRKVADKIPE